MAEQDLAPTRPDLAPPAVAGPGIVPLPVVAALAFQLLLVGGIAAPQIRAHAVGTTVRLQAAPHDPYDLLRGRYMRLGQPGLADEALARVPGAPAAGAEASDALWVRLAPGEAGAPWHPVAVSPSRPDAVPGQVLLRAERANGGWRWGLEQYFIPESRGEAIEAAMRRAQEASRPIEVEARVGPDGTAVLEALWIDGKAF